MCAGAKLGVYSQYTCWKAVDHCTMHYALIFQKKENANNYGNARSDLVQTMHLREKCALTQTIHKS